MWLGDVSDIQSCCATLDQTNTGYVSTELTVILLSHIYLTDISLGGHGVKK